LEILGLADAEELVSAAIPVTLTTAGRSKQVASTITRSHGSSKRKIVISIFGNNDNGQARVPAMEVNGDELRVNGGPVDVPPIDATGDQPNQPQQTSYKMPKSKWFCSTTTGGEAKCLTLSVTKGTRNKQ